MARGRLLYNLAIAKTQKWAASCGRFDRRRVLLWFLLGWAGHALAHFLTHAYALRPLV